MAVVLLAPSRWRPAMLLNCLPCTGQPCLTAKSGPMQNVGTANPGLEVLSVLTQATFENVKATGWGE